MLTESRIFMIEIQPIEKLNIEELRHIASGYSSEGKYVVNYSGAEDLTSFKISLVDLEQPFIKHYDHIDDHTAKRYSEVLEQGYSFSAFDRNLLVGIVISEPRWWNQSLWVWEYHVADSYRLKGIGKKLLEAVISKARETGLRIVTCETQNTNAAAIKVYHQLGFRIEGIDISYYSNNDYPDREIAVFMKRRL
jgi:ribosomal protein S18 acetylase RimI-like enzyme